MKNVEDENREIIWKETVMSERWTEYFQKLYGVGVYDEGIVYQQQMQSRKRKCTTITRIIR